MKRRKWWLILVALAAACAKEQPSTPTAPQAGVTAAFYASGDFETKPVERAEPNIEGPVALPPGVQGEMIGVRWSGSVKPLYSEEYTFRGVGPRQSLSIEIDGTLVVRVPPPGSAQPELHKPIRLEAGKLDALRVTYFGPLPDMPSLHWKSASQGDEVVPEGCLRP